MSYFIETEENEELKADSDFYLKETKDILRAINKYTKEDMLKLVSKLRQSWHELLNKKLAIEEKMYKYEESLYEVESTILKLKEAIQENNVADYDLYIDYVLNKINEVLK